MPVDDLEKAAEQPALRRRPGSGPRKPRLDGGERPGSSAVAVGDLAIVIARLARRAAAPLVSRRGAAVALAAPGRLAARPVRGPRALPAKPPFGEQLEPQRAGDRCRLDELAPGRVSPSR